MTDENYLDYNLEDIARLSGVSRSTVSRVVNNHPNVSERTRRQVMEIINKYSFQPNNAARALASQRSKVIGILIPHIITHIFTDIFYSLLLEAISKRANQLDYGVTLWLSVTLDGMIERVLSNRLLDGLVIAAAMADASFVELLDKRGKPYVLVGHPMVENKQAYFVDVENETGGRLMTRHLLAGNRQRIGMIPGRKDFVSSQDRENAYRKAMIEADKFDAALIGPAGNFTEMGGYQSMRYLLRQNVDAVFCASDVMAIGAMKAIKEVGKRIPDDIAVGGFDDMTIASQSDPPLTTIRQSINLLGATATETLIRLLEGRTDVPSKQILPVELIVRQST